MANGQNIILKRENGPRASSAPALGLNTIIFKHVYWYMQQISGDRFQDHWSSGLIMVFEIAFVYLQEIDKNLTRIPFKHISCQVQKFNQI